MKKFFLLFFLTMSFSVSAFARDRVACFSDFHISSIDTLINEEVRDNEIIVSMTNIRHGSTSYVCVVFRTAPASRQ